MRNTLRALVIVLLPGICAGQAPSPTAAATQMVRAAGMPLNDGALAPGMMTVRVVEGAFTRDIANQLVELEVAGGKIESARTRPDGRAQFAHLPIGARVRVWSAVDGERLESDSFSMPAESGVRVLLVAGAGTGVPVSSTPGPGAGPLPPNAGSTLPPNHPPIPDAPAIAVTPVPVARTSTGGEGVLAVRAVLLTATVFAFGIVLFRRPRRRPHRA
jgi:hypothetical protein